MNQQQIKYAVNRIKEVKEILLKKVDKKYVIPSTNVTNTEKYDLIQTGKVKLPSIKYITGKIRIVKQQYSYNSNEDHDVIYPSWDKLFKFSKFQKKGYTKKGYIAKRNSIQKKATDLIDDLILGDAKKALQGIAKFENTVI